MAKRDYYEVLGVQKNAGEEELKSAFRNKAKELHPDRNPGNKDAEVKFKEVGEAYEVLKDPQKRAAYDQFGHAAFEGGRAGAAARAASVPTSRRPCPISSTTCSASSWAAGVAAPAARRPAARHRRERGADLRYNMEIALAEAFAGKTAQIRVPASVSCETCSGTGAKPGTKPKTCATCGGAGKVRASQGFFTIERTCPTCQGRGEVIDDPVRHVLTARAASPRSARSPSTFRQASRTARASASPAKARPACAAVRPAISTFSSRSSRTTSSSATAPTCSAGCRSP